MRERGVVINVTGGRALIEVTPAEGCGKSCSCSAVEGNARLRRIELEAPDGVRPGSLVTLEVDSGQVLASSAVVFLVPLVLLMAGAIVSKPLLAPLGLRMSPDAGMLLCGAVGFLVGLAGAILFSRRGARRGWLKPRIVEVVNPTS